MANVKEFNLNITKFAKNIKADTAKVLKIASFKVLGGVIKKTPVDIGVAQASWVVGLGKPAAKFISPDGKQTGQRDGILAKINKRNIQRVVISNYVPYIIPLENGHSVIQAPKGMAKLTLMEVHNELKAGI